MITARESLGEGVYYARGDYVGILRRLVILVVDATVILVGWLSTVLVLSFLVPELQLRAAVFSVCPLAWLYLTVFKPSRFRTLGFRLAGTRIVTSKAPDHRCRE